MKEKSTRKNLVFDIGHIETATLVGIRRMRPIIETVTLVDTATAGVLHQWKGCSEA